MPGNPADPWTGNPRGVSAATNFGFHKGQAQSNPAYDGISNNVVGLLYRYGIKYDLTRIPNP